jgi:hypothetical protein
MANLFSDAAFDADSRLAAGRQYTGTTPQQRGFVMMILYGLVLWNSMSPLLTPRWQQGVDSVKRLLRKSGARI